MSHFLERAEKLFHQYNLKRDKNNKMSVKSWRHLIFFSMKNIYLLFVPAEKNLKNMCPITGLRLVDFENAYHLSKYLIIFSP